MSNGTSGDREAYCSKLRDRVKVYLSFTSNVIEDVVDRLLSVITRYCTLKVSRTLSCPTDLRVAQQLSVRLQRLFGLPKEEIVHLSHLLKSFKSPICQTKHTSRNLPLALLSLLVDNATECLQGALGIVLLESCL